MTSYGRAITVLRGGIPDIMPHALYDVVIDICNGSTIDLSFDKAGKHPGDVSNYDLRGAPHTERAMH